MKRREAIQNTALLMGYAVSATTITAVLNGCTSEAASGKIDEAWRPGFFTDDEMALLSEVTETILPATETPGAKNVQVERYVDVMISEHSDAIEQADFRNGLQSIDDECSARYGVGFLPARSDQRHSILEEMDRETRAYIKANPESGYRPFFARLKELTFIGYFTSELVGKEILNYDPVPGVYHGCIPLNETGGKLWSL